LEKYYIAKKEGVKMMNEKIMNEKEVMVKIEKMPMEEKIKLLSVTDKAYIRGFIERAVFEQQRNGSPKRHRASNSAGEKKE
jgi:hypothetical protein